MAFLFLCLQRLRILKDLLIEFKNKKFLLKTFICVYGSCNKLISERLKFRYSQKWPKEAIKSMQKALRDELEKYQVSKSVTLKEGEILVTTSEELPCDSVFHVSCKSLLLSFLYLYYQYLRSSILQSTYKEFNKCTGFFSGSTAKLIMSWSYTCLHFDGFFSPIF